MFEAFKTNLKDFDELQNIKADLNNRISHYLNYFVHKIYFVICLKLSKLNLTSKKI